MGPTPAVADVRRAVRTSLSDLRGRADRPLVLVACSGGADSLALAAALTFERRGLGIRAGGVTVDHDLQAGSADHAAQVAAALRELGLDPVRSIRVRVDRAGGPEAAARTARYRALDDVAAQEGAVAVLLGHTRDDQAETVLLGLARGSGARSLAGMPDVRGIYRRPLLSLSRETVRHACSDLDLRPWSDQHNEDPAFARSRVRQRALPVLEETLGPGIAEALARSARLLRDDADALDAIAAAAYANCVGEDGAVSVRRLLREVPAVRSRVLRRAALAAGCPAGALTAGHVSEVDRLASSWSGQRPLDLPGGVAAGRRGDTIAFRASGRDSPSTSRPA